MCEKKKLLRKRKLYKTILWKYNILPDVHLFIMSAVDEALISKV